MNSFSKKLLFIWLAFGSHFNLHALDAELLIEHVKSSIKNAQEGKSKLTNDVLSLDGLSSSKVT